MSEHREQIETPVSLTAKVLKIVGWLGVVVGVLLTATLIGAAAGIPMIIGGLCFVFIFPKIFAKVGAVSIEKAEIHEHMLRQARASKPLDEPRQDEANHK